MQRFLHCHIIFLTISSLEGANAVPRAQPLTLTSPPRLFPRCRYLPLPSSLQHNGIIENFGPLREMLLRKGHTFYSETDTEVRFRSAPVPSRSLGIVSSGPAAAAARRSS
jgi:hypothetical protein